MYRITYWLLKKWIPFVYKIVVNIMYSGSRVSIGRGVSFEGIPRFLVDRGSKLEIGAGSIIRKGVEVRVHNNSIVRIGDCVKLDLGVRIIATNGKPILIGERTRIGLHSVINGGSEVTIGDNTLISGFVYIQTSQHVFNQKEKDITQSGYEYGNVRIGNNAWLAAHVVVMPGVSIGNRAVVGSNGVVTKNLNSDSVNVGIPAKEIKRI